MYVISSVDVKKATFDLGPPQGQRIDACLSCDIAGVSQCVLDPITGMLYYYECSYSCKRFPEDFPTMSYNGYEGKLSAADCSCPAAEKSSNPLELVYYIDPEFNPACETGGCDGSSSQPYDDIYWVARQVIELQHVFILTN